MLIIMQVRATSEEVDNVVHRVESLGLKAHLSLGEERVIIGAIGEGREALEHLTGIYRHDRCGSGDANFTAI